MKRVFLLVALFALVLLTGACKKDKDIVKAYAKVEVKQRGIIKAGIPVYMFTENTGPHTAFFSSFFAKKTVISDADGVATFELQDVFDLELISTQTTLYFGVFGNDDIILGSVGLTIKKGETKMVTINL